MAVRRLSSVAEIDDLCARLLDPARDEPVVVVTTRNRDPEPIIDAAALSLAIAPLEVLLLPTGDLTRHLTACLPDLLGVFGGAARICWPGLTAEADPHQHPLVFAHTSDEAPRAQQAAGPTRRRPPRWIT